MRKLLKRLLQKHIFCEKPVSFSVEETLEALEVVKEQGVSLQVGFNRRFDLTSGKCMILFNTEKWDNHIF